MQFTGGGLNLTPIVRSILGSFFASFKLDHFVKSLFVNDFEHFGEKALMMFSVKNAKAGQSWVPRAKRSLPVLHEEPFKGNQQSELKTFYETITFDPA